MTDELNKTEEYGGEDKSLPTSDVPMATERLKVLSGLIKETDKNAENRKGTRERLAAEGEINRDRRREETRAVMEENSERARAAAMERAARLEYGAEYRRTFIERENKRALAEKARLDAEQKEAEMLREAERKSEIEDFIRREREELEQRNQRTKSILEKINGEAALNDKGSDAEKESDEELLQTQEKIDKDDNKSPEETNIAQKKSDTTSDNSRENGDSDRIILNIATGLKNHQELKTVGENIIHIPALYCIGSVDVNVNTDLHYGDSPCIDEAEGMEQEPIVYENYPELLNESAYREYYRGAAELYERELLDEYEKYVSEKDEKEPYVPESYADKNEIEIGIDRSGKISEDIDGFAKAELSRHLGVYHKQETALRSSLRKIEVKQKNAPYAENVRLTVERIGVHKEIVEVAIEALRACVYAGSRVNTAKHRKFLEKEIYRYNSAVSEYETLTGKKLTRLSPKMAADVEEGRICQSIPNVYYVNEIHRQSESHIHHEPSAPTEYFNSDARKQTLPPDTENFDDDFGVAREREKDFAKERAKRVSEIRRLSERDVLLVALRNEYKLSKYEKEYHMLQHSFSLKRKQKVKRMQKLDKRISKIRSNLKRSIKLERDDNRRYYYLLTVDPLKERVKNDARRDELDALKLRLEILLREREEINERIIALYGGSDKNLRGLKIDRKATGVRKKFTKLMYKRQERIAARIQRMKAPEDLKEKFFALLNKKTEKVGVLEEQIYKLKKGKLKGKARHELESEIKRAKASIKYIESDMKYVMKKLRRHQERYEDDRSWAITLIVFSVISVACVACWYFFGDSIKAYLSELVAALRRRLT